MKLAKRGIALLLAAVFLFGTLAVPARAAAAPAGTGSRQKPWMQQKMISSHPHQGIGELTYGADHKLEIRLPRPMPSISVWSWAPAGRLPAGYVTLVLSGKDPHPA